MGWDFGYGQRRAELIAERTEPREWDRNDGTHVQDIVLAHCFRGGAFSGNFYAVHERTQTRDGAEIARERWIEVTLMACRSFPGYGPSWGYKDMCETMGPGVVSCPLSYLAMVPEPSCEPGCVACAEDRCGQKWARNWREGVRRYWAERKDQARKRRALKVGDRAALVAGCKVSAVVIESLRPLIGRGVEDGRCYRVRQAVLA